MWKYLGIACLFSALAAAETVHLNDGSVVHGKIYRNGAGWTLVLPNGSTRTFSAAEVVSIDLTADGASGGELEDQLASLRHSLEYADDPAQAIVRLQNFIQHNSGTPAAEDAQKDLALWQDRQAHHLMKIGGEWITPQDAERVRQQSVLLADHARQLIRAGNIAGARQQIDQIVAVDPQSIPGLYLQGVLAFNASEFDLAEKDFKAVAERAPHHGPTLNNLAVWSFHTQHYAQSAGLYLQAIQADALDRLILDNVAELLHAIPSDLLTVPEVRALQAEFARQDAALQQILAKQNLSRWGSRWVTTDQMKQIFAAQKLIQQKLAAMSSDQVQVRASIAALDQQIAANEQSEQQMANANYVVNPATGRVAYGTYPQAYYDLERDDVDLKSRRQAAIAKLDDINAAIRATQTQFPVQPYTGVQQIIGEEGTPIAPAPQPTTQPLTTRPSSPVLETGDGTSVPLR